MEPKTSLNPTIFRPETTLPTYPLRANFVITNGGLGDYICFMSAILWIARNHPQLHGILYVPDFFYPLAKHFVHSQTTTTNSSGNLNHWDIRPRHILAADLDKTIPLFAPYDQPINGTGCHLVDLGFIFYAHLNPPPPNGNFYPTTNKTTLIGKYGSNGFTNGNVDEKKNIIFTPGATYANRKFPPRTFNALTKYVTEKGFTPVFLGTHKIGTRDVLFDEGYDLRNGLNLINKTTLEEAAQLMHNAALVIGLDNGLLHLAATTPTPIIFGYNIASPEHRRPRRLVGKTYDIYPDEEKLSCTFCQSKMRFHGQHDFKECYYTDNKCLDALDDPRIWTDMIDLVLEESTQNGK